MSFKLSLFSDDGKLMPLANDDEMFILERPGVSFTCTTASGYVYRRCTWYMTVFQLTAHEWWLLVHRSKFKANGRIYITTQRLVFCADKGTTQHDTVFEAFVRPSDIDASFVAKQQQKAFVDPNDPSVIYVTQPVRPPRKPMASC
ncbi:hypothetical protein DYB31_015641 [Aphanomyces astaci]|uniref:GRAM domain-containing protein n=1 Tax=Aphanomyces astaci TaxID=112090 RepID=A0A397ERX6_APHAT|nr:hypothetical protein DYB31_015641 [Aphanomyces astaci]